LSNLAIERFLAGGTITGKLLQIRAAAIPIALARHKLIEPDHPMVATFIALLHQLLQAIDDKSDPRVLAEADAAQAIADHAAWEDGETPDWPT